MPARRIDLGFRPASDLPPPAAPVAGSTVTPAPVGSVALYDIDPDTVAALVVSCPAVAGLSGGRFGAAATYLAGRSVAGIRINPEAVEVHVVIKYGASVEVLAGQIRRVLSGQVRGRAVDIVVEDVADPTVNVATTALPAVSTVAASTSSGVPGPASPVVAPPVTAPIGQPRPSAPPPVGR